MSIEHAPQPLPNSDSLTGLPNRAWLSSELDVAVSRHPGEFALLFVDVDGLKHKNDTEGHEAGDQLIKETAAILQGDIRVGLLSHGEHRDPDQIGRAAFRLAGDEFVVLLSGVKTQEEVDAAKERLQADLLEKGSGGGIQASMGGRPHYIGESPAEFLNAVDNLMYAEKRGRKAYKEARANHDARMNLRKQAEALPWIKLAAYGIGSKLVKMSGIKQLPPK